MNGEQMLELLGRLDDSLIEEAMTARPARRSAMRVLWTAAITAALVLTLTVGAAATGVLKPLQDALSPLFGGSAAQAEAIGQMGQALGVSAESGGLTLTADAIIADRYGYTIVYTVEQPGIDAEGVPPIAFRAVDSTGSLWRYGAGPGVFVDETPRDGKLHYYQSGFIGLAANQLGEDPPKGRAGVTFTDLVYTHEKTEESSPDDPWAVFLEGTWSLEFDLRCEDASTALPAGQRFTVEGRPATLEKLVFSPIGLRVEYTVAAVVTRPEEERCSAEDLRLDDRLSSASIRITKKDGTRILHEGGFGPEDEKAEHCLNHWNGAEISQDGIMRVHNTVAFDQIVSLEEIETVEVEGVEVYRAE